MAASMLLNWKCAAIFITIAIATASAGTPSNVTLFTFTAPDSGVMSTVVNAGTTVTMRCRAVYNSTRPPTVHLRKSFGNGTWHMATGDSLDDAFLTLTRFSASIIDNILNGADVYDWTISNAQLGDTGNYTCYTQSGNNISSLSVSLNVSAEPTQLSLYINNELQNQSMSPSINKKTLIVGQTYRLTCVASGSNPFPIVTLTSGTNVLTPDTTNMTTTRVNYVDAVSPVTRVSTVSALWTMTNANLGVTVMCAAGVKNPTAVSNSFIAIADNALPNFNCPDQFNYDGKQTMLTVTCSVASSDLSSYYITWRNSTTNMTMNVTGRPGIDIQAPGDSRYVLRVNAPQNNDVWWTMTLTINNANAIRDLDKTTFRYVAIGSKGQAAHDVMIKSSMSSGPTSGGRLGASAIGHVALLISIAMAILFSRQ